MRLIDADALYKAITTSIDYCEDILEIIDRQSTVEPKKGKWIEHNPHRWGLGIVFECSECGEEIDCESSNFCPNCGADMRGEEDDT